MIDVQLNQEEREALREMLGEMVSELRMEIADTDRLEYRDMLRDRKLLLMRVADALLPVARPGLPA